MDYSIPVRKACAAVGDRGTPSVRGPPVYFSSKPACNDDILRISLLTNSLQLPSLIYLSTEQAETECNACPIHMKTSQPSNAAAWPPQSTKPVETSPTTEVPNQYRCPRKVTTAFKAMRRIFSPNRATQGCPCSTRKDDGHIDTPSYTRQTDQDQARHPSHQEHNLPRHLRSYPVRSAMRGARPKKATDSCRHVHFADEAWQSSERQHQLPRNPRFYPVRSALRGSRPKRATDYSRHVHFADEV